MKILKRPGYLGRRRNDTYAAWDVEYGRDNWQLLWKVNENYLNFLGVCTLYEDAYFEFIAARPRDGIFINELITAKDVYDDSPTNVNSGLDYTIQETNHTHIQDVAIRRCLVRLGLWFKGPELLQIRDSQGKSPLSMILSPGQIMFHRADWIEKPFLEGWWLPGSIECFYQSNKFLVLRE